MPDVELVGTAEKKRIEFIDLARGLAVTLMILSHGVKGLLAFEQFPDWGLVPIHLITKFSSTLFFMVFGLSMAMIFVPLTDAPEWPARRRRLLLRGIKILFWYKILTILEFFQFGGPEKIMSALTYQSFTSFVEILGFYAIVFLWVPWILPLWRKTPWYLRVLVPVAFFALNHFLYKNFDFWGIPQIKAIFVEEENYYTWGQFARAPLVFIGMLIGDLARWTYEDLKKRSLLAGGLITVGGALFLAFFQVVGPKVSEVLFAIARNEGKHPPELDFMLWSMAGAFLILGLVILGGERTAKVLKPITIIGQDALQAFVFHIFVLFVCYRYLFNYWQKIPYEKALSLTVLLIVLTPIWIRVKIWMTKNS